MKIIAITRKGISKTENEDRVVVGKSILAESTLVSEIDRGVLAIADGIHDFLSVDQMEEIIGAYLNYVLQS